MFGSVASFLFVLCIVPVQSDDEIRDYSSFVDRSARGGSWVVNPRVHLAPRRRRNINSDELEIVELGDWVLELYEGGGGSLRVPAKIEWVAGDGIHYKSAPRCEYRWGHVRELEGLSSAVLAICNEEMSGYFRVGKDLYVIEPQNGGHVMHRRDAGWDFYNLTGDTIEIGLAKELDEVENNEIYVVDKPTNESLEWKREQIESEEVGYFFDTAWQPSFITQRKNGKLTGNPRRWLEIAVAVDNTVIAFHGKTRVEQYVLSLMNIVNAIYQDPSLDANIQLVISRLILYEHKRHGVIRPGNAKKSLENVNIWNKGLHVSLAPGETHHDVAVWLTRADIGGPSGYAPVSGACDHERSCALNRDEGLTSAFIIAHEMAHVLGLTHDGDNKSSNDCLNETLSGSVMAPMVSATFHQFLWSECSRREFKTRANKWKCLLNPPAGAVGEITLNSTLLTTFSMDEQCRMEFGDGYSLCRAFDIVEPCSHLWCGHIRSPLVCKTKKGPPLEGTECGFDKWCVSGYCEAVDKNKFGVVLPVQHNPQDGGWGDWGAWGPCSRSCGTGVEFRLRKCDKPVPVYGGSDCFGSKEEWRICNAAECPEPIRDIRAQQCKRLPRLLQLESPRDKMSWLPFESDEYEMKCKLICSSKESQELYITGENLIDGTPCSYENSSDICIQGTCQRLGCDLRLFSVQQEDACGVCGGNNSDCSSIKLTTRRRLKRDVSRVAVIPRFARDIQVETIFSMDATVAFMLKDRKRNSVSLTIPNVGNRILEGTRFYYERTKERHLLRARGPVLAEIIVLVYAASTQVDGGLNVSVRSEFHLHRNLTDAKRKYRWIVGGWGACSRSCGGGRRFKTKACFDDHNKKIVQRKLCNLAKKPDAEYEHCNSFSCNFHWMPGEWEACSTTCGSHGLQSREIYCIPQSIFLSANRTLPDEAWKFMVAPEKCGDTKPTDVRPCFRRPCPSSWSYGDWSQCSASCGRGFSMRESFCSPLVNETLYSCNELPAKQRKPCKGAFNRHNNSSCNTRKICWSDSFKHCSLQVLLRYCELGSYRRMCCKSCARHRITPFIQ